MALADLTDPEAVLRAIRQYDELGRDPFLAEYKFGKSRRWVLVHDGHTYDSKAIVGAAHGFQHPDQGPLKSSQFTGGAHTTVPKLQSLGFDVQFVGDVTPPSFAFTAEDCALFAKYPTKVPFKDDVVPPEDKAKFKDIWTRLKALAAWLAEAADAGVALTSDTSHYAQNGRSQTDLWSCAYPTGVPNKSYGLQVAIIVSADGAELCFCLGAGRSTLTGPNEQQAKAVLAEMKAALASVPDEVRSQVEGSIKPEWDLRRQWRRPSGTQDFSDLRTWLEHAVSAEGNGASVSRNLTVSQLEAAGVGIADELLELADAFAPLLQYVYGDADESKIRRALNEYEGEWNTEHIAKIQASFEMHRDRFDDLFGSLEKIDALSPEDFFGFLNDLDAHVSPETGIFTLGPGLPAPKDPSLPTWQKLVEDLPKLHMTIKRLLYGEPKDELAGRIDAMLGLPAPRRYITTQLALPSILLCLADPENHSGVQRMPKKHEKLEAMGLLPDLPETATDGERFVAYEEILSTLPARHGKDWDWATRDGFYWSDAFNRNFGTPDGAGDSESGTDGPATSDNLAEVAAAVYVQESFLREVVELLEEKRQIVFFGPPGTGKTHIAQELIAALAPEDEQREIVQFHPSYSYEDFVLGFRPMLTEGGELGYSLHRGPLLRIAERALANPGKRFILLIDEINRGNLPRIFGELLFLLEYRNQRIALMYSPPPGMRDPSDPIDAEGRFALPSNLWIVGTMNTADRSIGLIDAALRRRFHFVPFFPDEGALNGLLRRWLQDTQAPDVEQVADWVDRLNALLRERFGRHLQVGHSYFMRKTLELEEIPRIWATDIMPFLEDQLMEEPRDLKQFTLDSIRSGAAESADEDADGFDSSGEESGADEAPVYADDSAP